MRISVETQDMMQAAEETFSQFFICFISGQAKKVPCVTWQPKKLLSIPCSTHLLISNRVLNCFFFRHVFLDELRPNQSPNCAATLEYINFCCSLFITNVSKKYFNANDSRCFFTNQVNILQPQNTRDEIAVEFLKASNMCILVKHESEIKCYKWIVKKPSLHILCF